MYLVFDRPGALSKRQGQRIDVHAIASHEVPESHATAAKRTGLLNGFSYLDAILGGQHHVEREGKAGDAGNARGPHDLPVRSGAADPIVRLLARTVEAECHSMERFAMRQQMPIDLPERVAITDKTEREARLDRQRDDLMEIGLEGRFATG